MAKTPTLPTPQAAAPSVNNDAANLALAPVINAVPVATPENTPVPGGGRWGWDHLHACWVDSDAHDAAAELAANSSPTLE